ncbi:MAG: SufE family protein [Chloroflexota bacterium]
MTNLPKELQEILEDFAFMSDRNERAEYLIEIADRFETVKVPETISTQPHPEENHVTMCESDAYVWAVDLGDGTQRYYFDVLNPQGLSAMAMSVILGETLSGQPPEVVAQVSTDIVFKIFGKEISMGKGQGLMGIVGMVSAFAKNKQQQA